MSDFMSDPRLESAFWEARARITWGESRGDVRAWLCAKGIAHVDALAIVAECVPQRAISIRKRGIGDLVVALVAAASGAAAILSFDPLMEAFQGWNLRNPRKHASSIVMLGIAACVYATYRAFCGIARIIQGAMTPGPDSDLGD
jgi:hypothetical protein